MLKIISHFKTKIGGTFGSILSAVGAGGGTTSAVCQTTCAVTPAAVSFLGASLTFTPFIFLFKYHAFLWWIAFAFLMLLILIYLAEVKRSRLDRILIILNTGLIIIGFPYSDWLPIKHFFLFLGGTTASIGLLLLVFYLLSKTKYLRR